MSDGPKEQSVNGLGSSQGSPDEGSFSSSEVIFQLDSLIKDLEQTLLTPPEDETHIEKTLREERFLMKAALETRKSDMEQYCQERQQNLDLMITNKALEKKIVALKGVVNKEREENEALKTCLSAVSTGSESKPEERKSEVPPRMAEKPEDNVNGSEEEIDRR